MNRSAIAAVLLFCAQAQAASLDGVTLQYEYIFPDSNAVFYSKLITVGDGKEVEDLYGYNNVGTLDIDSTDTLSIDFSLNSIWNPAEFNGFRITDFSNSLADITSFSIVSNDLNSTPTFGYTANSLWVNWQGISFLEGDQLRFSIGVGDVSAVPLPGAATLMLGGLTFLAGLRRKRKGQTCLANNAVAV